MTAIRPARAIDIPSLLELQRASYPTLASVSAWQAHHFESHLKHFPEGQLVACRGPILIGVALSFVTTWEKATRPHSFREITQAGTFGGHDPLGNALYGAEIMVHPAFRGQGVARHLYNARYALVRDLGLRYFIAGGRLPQFSEHASEIGVDEYVASVIAGERTDRVLTPQLRNGLRVMGILPDYLNDPRSRNFATLLVWENPDFVGSPGIGQSSLGPEQGRRIRTLRAGQPPCVPSLLPGPPASAGSGPGGRVPRGPRRRARAPVA